jgi:glycosyltransferase involved in cell wall biosynthesis
MISPLVSVILTVFEREKFLPTAIEGVLAQTFSNYEIIVTDDSNKASIRQICELFHCGNRLRYRSNAKQLGVPLNVRGAIQEAKGKYIVILNDDDYWEPTFLEKLVPPLEENTNRVVAFSDHWIVHEDGMVDKMATEANTLQYHRKMVSRGVIQDSPGFVLKKNGLPLAMASLFRKDALDLSLLTKEVVGAYDFWISCILAASGKAFYYVPERLTYYRVHGQSETARKSPDKSQPVIFIFQQLLERNWFPQMRFFLEHRLAVAHYSNGRDLLWFSQTVPAREMFRKAIRVSWHQKSITAFALSFAPLFIRRRFHLSQ